MPCFWSDLFTANVTFVKCDFFTVRLTYVTQIMNVFQDSLTKSQPIQTDAPGRSGARFFTSYDKMCYIKTLTSDEVERMHHLLKQYHPVSENYRFTSFVILISFVKNVSHDRWIRFILHYLHSLTCGQYNRDSKGQEL